jgi:hypothetical protein
VTESDYIDGVQVSKEASKQAAKQAGRKTGSRARMRQDEAR